MTSAALLLVSLVLAHGPVTGPIGNAPVGNAPIQWGSHTLTMEALPSDLPEGARAALQAWYGWASEHDCRLDLLESGRLLLVCRRSNDRVDTLLGFARRVVERFDRELPAPAVRLEAKAVSLGTPKAPEPPPRPSSSKPVPEDPEDVGGDHPWALAPPKPAEPVTSGFKVTTWGAQGQPLDSQTPVLFVLQDQGDFDALLRHMGEQFPFLGGWTGEARALQGFVLGEPLAGAYLLAPAGVEEWDPDHELVNRLARLCLLGRFGELPNWLVQGYAWHQEMAESRSIYCFPWRDEFVGVGEHSGWERAVKNRYEKARPKPVDFMGWKRGVYRDPEAKASWGLTEYLVAREKDKLPALLERLRVFHEEHARIQEDSAHWRRDTEYEMPVNEQQKLFVELLDSSYLDRAQTFFRQDLGH